MARPMSGRATFTMEVSTTNISCVSTKIPTASVTEPCRTLTIAPVGGTGRVWGARVGAVGEFPLIITHPLSSFARTSGHLPPLLVRQTRCAKILAAVARLRRG
ncbi:hypothetical protein Pka01_66000 [Planotetraspora kaengkrachanensis]|uniref:Uncharacterized protein n=1 Tax=Planotetraspora kaengkrachanensis TaxID=575193 RepID=A0A8J3VAT4_9ACTN|nr:hypothetical protein Pka01_66000 [Planotetraspora kaengkrachanensis]